MNKAIGTCSLCGGRVSVPEPWMSTQPPVPTCEKCGATMKSHGPVIEMEPRLPPNTYPMGTIVVPVGITVKP